jgi:hypothetical protein
MQANERWLKRIAIQIAAQLPENEGEALLTLDYARELVVGFLAPAKPNGLRLVTEPFSERIPPIGSQSVPVALNGPRNRSNRGSRPLPRIP